MANTTESSQSKFLTNRIWNVPSISARWYFCWQHGLQGAQPNLVSSTSIYEILRKTRNDPCIITNKKSEKSTPNGDSYARRTHLARKRILETLPLESRRRLSEWETEFNPLVVHSSRVQPNSNLFEMSDWKSDVCAMKESSIKFIDKFGLRF